MRKTSAFERELAELLNKHSRESFSSTPDFLIARFLIGCLKSYETAMLANTKWHSEGIPVPWDERQHRLRDALDLIESIESSFEDVDERLRLLVSDAGDDDAPVILARARVDLVEYLLSLNWTAEDIRDRLLRTLP
jgi:hypothetical protein